MPQNYSTIEDYKIKFGAGLCPTPNSFYYAIGYRFLIVS